jgi:DinB superfamily
MMQNSNLEKLQYPIGKFNPPTTYTAVYIKEKITEIDSFPKRLRDETVHLTESQLDTPYRDGGWTIRQVIHHCADSHMNCLMRIKWALTEETPTIKFYYEDRWGELIDNKTMPIAPSLDFLSGLHFRLAFLLKNLTIIDLDKSFIHPEHGKSFSIKEIIGTYAWHGNHHLAHITELKKRLNWD